MATLSATEALKRLKEGNERFRTGHTVAQRPEGAWDERRFQDQYPFAVILTCSDSRVAPEIVFDTGLGDLFVIRVAGNVANSSTIASAEFAISQLGTRLVVVMAHQNCGAVIAARSGGQASRNMSRLLGHLQPALDPPDQHVDAIARRNARNSAARLAGESDVIRAASEDGDVDIVTAFFDFSNGEVDFDR